MGYYILIIVLLLLFMALAYLKDTIDTFTNNCDKNIEKFKVSEAEANCEEKIECYLCNKEGRTNCGKDCSEDPRKIDVCLEAAKENPYIFHSLGKKMTIKTPDSSKSMTFPNKKEFSYVNLKDFGNKFKENITKIIPKDNVPKSNENPLGEYKDDLAKLEKKIMNALEKKTMNALGKKKQIEKTDYSNKYINKTELLPYPDMSLYVKKSEADKCRKNNSKYILKSKIPGKLTAPDPNKYILKSQIKACPSYSDQLQNNLISKNVRARIFQDVVWGVDDNVGYNNYYKNPDSYDKDRLKGCDNKDNRVFDLF